ncbi:MAG: hypothetical protein OEM59_15925 [Rhodospirillales bacterium]|nr:hypothetical protein [Rhodospirillales bacterium]
MKALTAAKGKPPNIGAPAPAGSTSTHETCTAPRFVLPVKGTAVGQNNTALARDKPNALLAKVVILCRGCPHIANFTDDRLFGQTERFYSIFC